MRHRIKEQDDAMSDVTSQEVKIDSYTLDRVRDCLDYLVATESGPYRDAADARSALPSPEEYGTHEPPLYALCWQQKPEGYVACDRMRGHGGPHSWTDR
jgi:hypothetical protein